ncbi:MAG: ABC transporter ATP-binding protein [Chitinispirillaceae bacterium]
MIRVKNLSVTYPGAEFPVLNGLDLEIGKGECVTISGPTGCGKSTLGLAMCGAIPSHVIARQTGFVQLAGVEISGKPLREISSTCGFLLQNVEHQIFTDTVDEEIAFGLENRGIPAKEIPDRIDRALTMMNAAHLRGRILRTLSAGERQRVVCASILALEQMILILDEPLAFLDRKAQHDFGLLIKALALQDMTILLFEHRRDLVRGIVSREMHLDKGILTENAPSPVEFQQVTRSTPGNNLCNVDKLRFGWNGSDLFDDVTFVIREGESIVLLGDNGSGKTTLLSLLMGLHKPVSGSIVICGHDTRRTPTARIAKQVALLFQHPDHQLFASRVIDELILQGVDRKIALHELEQVDLISRAHHHPRSLSMGQKRRLTVAAALARKPKLLLLDEPSVGQDDTSLALVLRRLDAFIHQGGTVFYTTHDERVARVLGTRTLILENRNIHAGDNDLALNFFKLDCCHERKVPK